jgi:hypothetical protein
MNLSNVQNVSYFNNDTDRANIILNIAARVCALHIHTLMWWTCSSREHDF